MTSRTTKGDQRRRQVAEAAGHVLLADGFRALTHRRVAEEASVPLGTTTYYFADLAELKRAAVGLLLDKEQRRRSAIKVTGRSAKATARALVELLLPHGPGDARQRAAVLYERLGEAVRDAELQPLISRDYGELRRHVQRILAPRQLDASLTLAVVEGRLIEWLTAAEDQDVLIRSVTADLSVLAANQS